jgi:hypothetical protein
MMQQANGTLTGAHFIAAYDAAMAAAQKLVK